MIAQCEAAGSEARVDASATNNCETNLVKNLTRRDLSLKEK